MAPSIKHLVRSKVHPLVWERIGQAKQEFFYTKQKWQCDEPLVPIFKKYLSGENGYYVDVGANDGRSSSNTYHLENSQGWKGVLIEPVMHVFFRSKQIRNLDANKFFNCACVSNDFKGDHVELFYAGLMTIGTSGHQEHDPESWANLGSQFLSRGEDVQKTWSQARTLDSILLEAKAPFEIDFLSIDVEGAELDVLRGLDLSQRTFKYILIETEKNSLAYELLSKNGYKHIETVNQNLLFSHSSVSN